MSKTASIDQTDRERLHEKFAQLWLRGYWQNRRDIQRMEPKLWRWKDIHPVLMETTEVIRIGPDAFRRNVARHGESAGAIGVSRIATRALPPQP